MPLLTPTQAAAAWLAVAAALLILFLLRRRAQRVLVPSLVPFREALPERANPVRRALVALLLQLAAAGAACWALVGPEQSAEASSVGEVPRVVVIDGSASMRARGRVEAALAVAADLRAGVVLAGPTPRVLSAPGEPTPAPDALELGWGRGSVSEATALARGFGGEVVVLSDHVGGEGWRVVGEGGADVSIDRLVASAGPGLPPEYALTAQISNHGDAAREVSLRVETGDAVLGEERLALPAGGTLERTWRLEPVEGRWVLARLVDHVDPLPDNDVLHAVLPGLRPARVQLVTEGNRYLEDLLRLMPGLTLELRRPGAWRAPTEPVDLIIFDRVAPRRAPEGSATVWLDPPEGAGPLPPKARLTDPVFSIWDTTHPILRGVAFRQLTVDVASTLTLRPGAQTLVATEEGPVVAVQDDAPRALVLGFDLARSDLPLTLAFPQLVYNIVRWGRADAVGEPAPASTLSAEGVTVRGPVELERLDAPGRWSFLAGKQRITQLDPGVYVLRDLDGERIVAVQLDPEEWARPDAGPAVSAAAEARAPEVEGERPRFAWLALIAAGLLCVELFVGLRG